MQSRTITRRKYCTLMMILMLITIRTMMIMTKWIVYITTMTFRVF